jgi:ATP-dependent helicase/nuclease subunit A
VIAPSFSFQDRDDIASGYDRDESLKRGQMIHRALELFCHEPPCTIEQTRQQLSNELAIDMNDTELNDCIEEAHATINNEQFTNLFKPTNEAKSYNELPVMYAQDNNMVYGIIDRLIVHEDMIELIDYKTHRVTDESTLVTLSQNYKQQLSLYREGISRIWPDRPVKSGLLFTNSARLIWID